MIDSPESQCGRGTYSDDSSSAPDRRKPSEVCVDLGAITVTLVAELATLRSTVSTLTEERNALRKAVKGVATAFASGYNDEMRASQWAAIEVLVELATPPSPRSES